MDLPVLPTLSPARRALVASRMQRIHQRRHHVLGAALPHGALQGTHGPGAGPWQNLPPGLVVVELTTIIDH